MISVSPTTQTTDIILRDGQVKKTHYCCSSKSSVKPRSPCKVPFQARPEPGDMADDLLKFMTYAG